MNSRIEGTSDCAYRTFRPSSGAGSPRFSSGLDTATFFVDILLDPAWLRPSILTVHHIKKTPMLLPVTNEQAQTRPLLVRVYALSWVAEKHKPLYERAVKHLLATTASTAYGFEGNDPFNNSEQVLIS